LRDGWPDGRIKLYLARSLLWARRAQSVLFQEGGYLPLVTRGPSARRLCAFARRKDDAVIVIIVPRLVVSLATGQGRMPLGPVWENSAIVAPTAIAGRRWTNLLTGERVPVMSDGEDRVWRAGDVFATLPAAVLIAAPD
jgi:maltooligosyltrehalose synthase